MDFNLVDLVITVRADDVFQLSLSLPLLGNSFSAACRKTACLHPEKSCDSCSRQKGCSWNLVFGQHLSPDPSALKRFQKPSLPFMFTFPCRDDLAEDVTEIECRLVVVGRAIQSLEMLLEGFGEILSTFGAVFLSIGTRDYQGVINLLDEVYSTNYLENIVILSSSDLFEHCIWSGSVLKIHLQSPLRLFEDGRLLRTFIFKRFAMSLLRRVSSLAYYYGAHEIASDYKELAHQADSIICLDDGFTFAAGGDRRISGVVGSGRFQGDFSGMLPFLSAGSYVHVGKGAAFSMGAYEFSGSKE
jgi:hypothetical protein